LDYIYVRRNDLSLTIVNRNVVTIEDIDRSWMGVMHTSMGPFGIMDQVGLSTVWIITDYWARKTGDAQAQANADFLKQYVDRGRLGLKTKQGFCSYPNPAYTEREFLSEKELNLRRAKPWKTYMKG
jgi:3-hydroxybutyryl-CoA dehydrogenase